VDKCSRTNKRRRSKGKLEVQKVTKQDAQHTLRLSHERTRATHHRWNRIRAMGMVEPQARHISVEAKEKFHSPRAESTTARAKPGRRIQGCSSITVLLEHPSGPKHAHLSLLAHPKQPQSLVRRSGEVHG
jgi:hypothetical protein